MQTVSACKSCLSIPCLLMVTFNFQTSSLLARKLANRVPQDACESESIYSMVNGNVAKDLAGGMRSV